MSAPIANQLTALLSKVKAYGAKTSENPQEQATIRQELVTLLGLKDFSPVYQLADTIREQEKGKTVQLRAILEFSNHCKRACKYCGLNCTNTHIQRYRMNAEEIYESAFAAHQAGYKTLVMQSGEDPFFTPQLLGDLIQTIKSQTQLAITLSCGEKSLAELTYLKSRGADRYLLKHETADPKLYQNLHSCGTLATRVQCLQTIRAVGLETGSGFMIGLPGQTLETISQDLLLLKSLQCHMAGIGPFIPHPATSLANAPQGSIELTKRAVALCRILLPQANLPATTSLGVLDPNAKADIFSTGANVVMKKVTPDAYKALYEIYPAKLQPTHIAAERKGLEKQIIGLNRIPL